MAFHQIQINSIHYDTHRSIGPHLRMGEMLYKMAAQCRLVAYRWRLLPTYRLPAPVISIGNLTTGGTGKTPVTIALAQFLESQGLRVVVLSRGYGSTHKTAFHEADDPKYGDEPYLIQQHLVRGKVIVGKDRVSTGKKAITQYEPDVILLDDGFQHIRLHRDVNVLLVDGDVGFGNGCLLPAGPLREPLSEIRRADWILLTRSHASHHEDQIQLLLRHWVPDRQVPVAPCPFVPTGAYHPASDTLYPLAHLENKPLVLLSGIAQPGLFEAMVQNHVPAVSLVHHAVFPDHYNYQPVDLVPLEELMTLYPEALLLTTEKDWVKIKGMHLETFYPRIFLLRIQPVFDWHRIVAPILPQVSVAHG